MKTIMFFATISLLSLTSCNYEDNDLNENELLNCICDSSFFYYTFNYERIYLCISTHCISIRFSKNVNKEYLYNLIQRNSELDSISIIDEEKNLAYGYTKGTFSM